MCLFSSFGAGFAQAGDGLHQGTVLRVFMHFSQSHSKKCVASPYEAVESFDEFILIYVL